LPVKSARRDWIGTIPAVTAFLLLTLPVFMLIGLGYGAVRSGLANGNQVDGLGMFVLNFALPALILDALSRQDLSQTFNPFYVAAYAAGSLVAFLGVLAALRLVVRRPLTEAAIGGLGASASNSGFIGFPLASLALGAPALTALPLNMLVENFLIIPLALALAEAGRQGGNSLRATLAQTALRLARMPMILAILAGAVMSGLGLHLPALLATPVEMLAKASAPCALFVVGGTIAGLGAGLATRGTMAAVGAIVVGKLILHPLAVAAALLLVGGVPRELAAAGILFAAVPMITIYPILGRRFGLEGISAAAMVVATAAGFVSVTIVLALLLGGG